MASGFGETEAGKLEKTLEGRGHRHGGQTADAEDHVVCFEVGPHEFSEIWWFVVCPGGQLVSDQMRDLSDQAQDWSSSFVDTKVRLILLNTGQQLFGQIPHHFNRVFILRHPLSAVLTVDFKGNPKNGMKVDRRVFLRILNRFRFFLNWWDLSICFLVSRICLGLRFVKSQIKSQIAARFVHE